ncbi:MAG: membrane lipoprotein lipid attachment site-containing protein [Clostridia bacterium]|nr:membrane lipoprotein lipid attachment site-containing protein [Clostridia bacterium]
MKKRIYLLTALFLLTGCGNAVTGEMSALPADPVENPAAAAKKPYRIETALQETVDDDLHNADVLLPEVVFPEDAALTEAVYEKITGPYLEQYEAYRNGAAIDFNWFTADYQVYEDERYLAVTVLSHDEGTYVSCPWITGAVVDLETMTLLSTTETIAAFGFTEASVTEEIQTLLPAVLDTRTPIWMEEILGAYLDKNGELIVVADTRDLYGDAPSNPYLYYNANRNAVALYISAVYDFDDMDTIRFLTKPADYVFDQARYDAYYTEPETMVIPADDPLIEPEILVFPAIEPEIPG